MIQEQRNQIEIGDIFNLPLEEIIFTVNSGSLEEHVKHTHNYTEDLLGRLKVTNQKSPKEVEANIQKQWRTPELLQRRKDNCPSLFIPSMLRTWWLRLGIHYLVCSLHNNHSETHPELSNLPYGCYIRQVSQLMIMVLLVESFLTEN